MLLGAVVIICEVITGMQMLIFVVIILVIIQM